MSDDLVKRLRDPAFGTETTERNLMGSAADRIEELEAERDEALNQLDSARHSISVLEKRVKTFCDGWGIADKGRIEAEAKLAKAVEALRQIEQGWVDEADPDTGVSIQVNMAADEMEDIARATLAELKG